MYSHKFHAAKLNAEVGTLKGLIQNSNVRASELLPILESIDRLHDLAIGLNDDADAFATTLNDQFNAVLCESCDTNWMERKRGYEPNICAGCKESHAADEATEKMLDQIER